MQIGSLFMALGFDVDDKKLNDFTGKVSGLKGAMTGLAGVAAAGVSALSAMTLQTVNMGSNLSNVSLLTQQATDDIQRLSSVMQGANPFVDAQQSLNAIMNVYQTMVDMEWGEGATGQLAMIGFDIENARGSVVDFFNEARRVWNTEMEGISQGRKIKIFQAAGISSEIINAIDLSQDRFNELWDRGIVSSKAIDDLKAINIELKDISYEYGVLSKRIGVMFAPKFKELVVDPAQWFLEQNKKIVDGIEAKLKGLPNPNTINLRRNIEERTSSEKIVEKVDLGISSLKAEKLAREWSAMMTQNNNTTNNINVETTADSQEVAESLYDMLEQQQNRSDIGEFPSTSYGGTR